MKIKRMKYWFRWNKKVVMKTAAILSVPVIGASIFMGYWFMKPDNIETIQPENPDNPEDTPDNPDDPYVPPGDQPDDPFLYNPTDITPIETKAFYPSTTSTGLFVDEFVEDILYQAMPDMINLEQEYTYYDSWFNLYYELEDDQTLNVWITEEIDEGIINESKFTYTIR